MLARKALLARLAASAASLAAGRQLGSARGDQLLEVFAVQVEFGSRQLLFGDIGPDRTDQHPAADVDCRCGNPGVLPGCRLSFDVLFSKTAEPSGSMPAIAAGHRLRSIAPGISTKVSAMEFITGVAKPISDADIQ